MDRLSRPLRLEPHLQSSSVKSCRFWWLLVASAMVGAAGTACFIVFCFACRNYAAGMWALSAAVFSFATLHLHILNLFDHITSWHDAQSLTQIKCLALGVCALSTVGCAVFGTLAFRMHSEIEFGENNFAMTTSAAGLSLLSGLVLLLTAITYRSHLTEAAERLLIHGPSDIIDS
ncbi:hypothetical protein BIW11_11798 [Tropilaelaps mercedesae]|uniref:Uncharacterized protein n=1 Tax=Tropilaelaps mercedesae TaxID=418985 RepID=A0A1V9X9Y1_9ACAR|nr:hypothetical protein BIW11_11798 [Tropilaelaps mercedesae]